MRLDAGSAIYQLVPAMAVLLLCTVGAWGNELARTVVWSAKLGTGVSSPVPYPNAQAADSVVAASGSQVVRVDGKGRVVFKHDLGEGIGGLPACGDVDGDGKVEVVAATARGRVVALTGGGKRKWVYQVGHPFQDFANVVLSPRAGGCEVLIGCQDGWLVCLDGGGRHQWTFRVAAAGHISSPAAADLNGDGQAEYVCGVDAGRVIALTHDGRLWWEFIVPEEEFGREVAVIADADGNGKPEVYILKAGATSALFCLDGATGKQRWVSPIGSKCYCSISVADINRDGQGEVLVGTKYNQIIAYSPAGKTLWQAQLGGNGIFVGPGVGDVNGDGRLEIITGVRQVDIDGNSLYVLDTEGKLLGSYPQEGEANAAVVIADVNGDGRLEVASSSRDTLFAYQFGSPQRSGAVLWPCYRGNAALNGCQLPLRPAKGPVPKAAAAPQGTLLPKTFSAILGDTTVTAAWKVATPQQGYVEVILVDPQGKRLTQAFPTQAGKQAVELALPFDQGGRYQLTARLLDTARRRVLLQENRQFTYTALAAERKLVAAALAGSRAVSATVPAASTLAAELERRRASLSATLASLQAQVDSVPASQPMPTPVLQAAAALRAQASREQGFTRFARKVADPGLCFVAWQDANPWDIADPRDELPAAAAEQVALAAWAYGSQREDFCLNLMSLGPEPLAVRVEPADLEGPGGAKAPWEEHLALHEVMWMPTRLNPTPVPDMLPAMNSGRTIEVAPGSFGQVWLVVDTKGLAPGPWGLKLRLQALTMAAGTVDVTMRLEVLPVALPFPYPWKMCNWAWPSGYPEPVRGKVIDNLISHGSNVLYAPAPTRACDEQGRLVGEVDWKPLEELVARAKPGDPFFFFTSLPLSAPQGMQQDAPEWKAAFGEWMREFVAHLASIGIDRRHYAFYPVDEPGNSGHTGIEQLIAAARVLREADPQAPIYADPAGGAYTAAWIRELDPWVDVWAPASGLSSRPELHEIISTRDRQVWMYDAPGNVRMLSPLGFYRRQPWSALRDGARGSGFWVYTYSDLWGAGIAREPDYGTVAIDRTEVVISRRWRAAHDGVQDVTAVLLLDEAISRAEQAGVPCRQAKAVRAAAVAAVTAGENELRLDWATLQKQRRLIAEATVALRQALKAR